MCTHNVQVYMLDVVYIYSSSIYVYRYKRRINISRDLKQETPCGNPNGDFVNIKLENIR